MNLYINSEYILFDYYPRSSCNKKYKSSVTIISGVRKNIDENSAYDEISMICQKAFNSFCGFGDVSRAIIRDIGSQLNEIGGFYLMRKIGTSLPQEWQRTVDHCWHGIGSWEA